ncbi:MAG TPA: SDR family oxidoreductase [Pirellulales bacterium]|jgi:nucleoside-diphosphate-sugar epimerase|nr:SDR family oxidoreductase [Pirellulales bacterium]
MAKLIFGCGYLGRRVADRWLAAGETVHVVTRSAARADSLRAQGLLSIVADVVRPASLVGLPVADTVLFAVGYDRTAGESIRKVYVDGLANVLAALSPDTGRFIYISSTGVYGQTGGQQVDETSECLPVREGGHACLDAERLLSAHPLGSRAITLRLAGIYGPGRIPSRQQLAAGQPLAVPADGCLNLIHVDDAASVVLAAELRAPLPRLYVVSDGQPVERRSYYEELARLVGAAPPRFAGAPPGSEALARSASDKRIDNARMRVELAVHLAYPSYREGLAQVVAAGESADDAATN